MNPLLQLEWLSEYYRAAPAQPLTLSSYNRFGLLIFDRFGSSTCFPWKAEALVGNLEKRLLQFQSIFAALSLRASSDVYISGCCHSKILLQSHGSWEIRKFWPKMIRYPFGVQCGISSNRNPKRQFQVKQATGRAHLLYNGQASALSVSSRASCGSATSQISCGILHRNRSGRYVPSVRGLADI